MFTNRLTGWAFESACVSAQLNVLITKPVVMLHVINVKHDYRIPDSTKRFK
jgi:hypothetical protein